MRGFPSDYRLERAGTLVEALNRMTAEPGAWTPLAGGTDLMVLFNGGYLKAPRLLDLSPIDELRGIQETVAEMSFGALTTFSELQECAAVHRFLPNLVKSARATGALAIQNRGTLGGNIANGSPAADTPPSLLAYGAELDLVSVRGVRRVPLDRFYLGYKKLDLATDELLLRIRVPKPEGRSFHFFRKVGTRQSLAITTVSLSGWAGVENGRVVRAGLGLASAGPTPARARNAEAVLLGQPLSNLPIAAAREALMTDISPIDDVRSTGHYRRVTAGNLLEQMLRELARTIS